MDRLECLLPGIRPFLQAMQDRAFGPAMAREKPQTFSRITAQVSLDGGLPALVPHLRRVAHDGIHRLPILPAQQSAADQVGITLRSIALLTEIVRHSTLVKDGENLFRLCVGLRSDTAYPDAETVPGKMPEFQLVSVGRRRDDPDSRQLQREQEFRGDPRDG